MACKGFSTLLFFFTILFSGTFAFNLAGAKHSYHARTSLAKISCQASGGMSRKSALLLVGTFPLWVGGAMAEDDDDDGDSE